MIYASAHATGILEAEVTDLADHPSGRQGDLRPSKMPTIRYSRRARYVGQHCFELCSYVPGSLHRGAPKDTRMYLGRPRRRRQRLPRRSRILTRVALLTRGVNKAMHDQDIAPASTPSQVIPSTPPCLVVLLAPPLRLDIRPLRLSNTLQSCPRLVFAHPLLQYSQMLSVRLLLTGKPSLRFADCRRLVPMSLRPPLLARGEATSELSRNSAKKTSMPKYSDA